MVFIFGWLCWCLLTGYVARSKNRSGVLWFLLAIPIPLLPLLFLLAIPRPKAQPTFVILRQDGTAIGPVAPPTPDGIGWFVDPKGKGRHRPPGYAPPAMLALEAFAAPEPAPAVVKHKEVSLVPAFIIFGVIVAIGLLTLALG